MKANKLLLILFVILSVLFIVGATFNINSLSMVPNFLLIPVLILYYRFKVKKWFIPMVVVLLLFYLRDLFLFRGFGENAAVVVFAFQAAIIILYIFAIVGFQRTKVHFVELVSLLIMYGFLGFLYFSIAELIPQVVPSNKWIAYIHLFLPTLLLAITFTQYLLKSHYASLWLMLGSASLLVSEMSLFFKIYVLSDISVDIFFPLFHVLAYYSLVQHAINRRRSLRIALF